MSMKTPKRAAWSVRRGVSQNAPPASNPNSMQPVLIPPPPLTWMLEDSDDEPPPDIVVTMTMPMQTASIKRIRSRRKEQTQMFSDSDTEIEGVSDGGRRIEIGRIPAYLNLPEHSLKGAGLYSRGRYPLPHCLPQTRTNIVTQILAWLSGENREQEVLWIFGPAGVGKTALAQTIGEHAVEHHALGAAVFFSRSRRVDNATFFITTLVFQLARRYPTYLAQVRLVIMKNPGILSSNKETQFKKLLVEPFSKLRRPPLPKLPIIIDGLDECWDDQEQLEIVRLVTESARSPNDVPFIWMVFSRPEHHLIQLVRDESVSRACLQLKLLPTEPGAHNDIKNYLKDGLEGIANRYQNELGPNKTLFVARAMNELNRLADEASGVFVAASYLLAFIGDPIIASPFSQLQGIIDTLDDPPSGGDDGKKFLEPMDKLLSGALERIKKDQITDTLQLLGSCAVSPSMPAMYLANFLGLSRETFYDILQPLHPFLSVPDDTTAIHETLHFFHASFPDFITHRNRSNAYFQDPDQHRTKLAKAFMQALQSTNIILSQNLIWFPSVDNGGGSVVVSTEQHTLSIFHGIMASALMYLWVRVLSWLLQGSQYDLVVEDESPSALSIAHGMRSSAAMHLWDVFTRMSVAQVGSILDATVLDFRCLRPFDEIPVLDFVRFVQRLNQLGKTVPSLEDFVRTTQLSDVDKKFIAKCGEMFKPLSFDSVAEVGDLGDVPRYVLAGFGAKTVLALFVPETVIVYSLDDIDSL